MPPQSPFQVPPQPTPVPTPQQVPPQMMPGPSQMPPAHRSRATLLIAIIALVLLVLGGTAYAYFQKIGPFASATYTEENIFSGLLVKIGQIKSSKTIISGSLAVEPRDPDAIPYVVKNSTLDLKQKYENDYIRVRDLRQIMSKISTYTFAEKKFPASLSVLPTAVGFYAYSIFDPVTEKSYEYKILDNGADFSLVVTFETDNAIQELLRANKYYPDTALKVTGKSIEFRKAQMNRFYSISSTLPEPFLAEWSKSLQYIPADISGSIAASVTGESKEGTLPQWIFNMNAEGVMGDLTYKINLDAIKKDRDYYVKINNIPSIFLFMSDFSAMKGKWVKFSSPQSSPSEVQGYYGSDLGYLQNELPRLEESYRKNKEDLARFMRKAVVIADEVKLASFKSGPKRETIDGRKLTRYELAINKEAIINFYTRLGEEVRKDESLGEYREFTGDIATLDYLKGSEFDEIFEYINKNTQFTLWVDDQGFPAIVQEAIRLVPADSAVQLKDKQIKIILRLVLSDINKSLDIKVPEDAVSFQELSLISAQDPVQQSSAIKSSLSAIRAKAELVYDQNGFGYGKNPFPLGPCKQTANTLFGDIKVFENISRATNNNPSVATCVSSAVSGTVEAYAVSVPLPDDADYSWCIDSTGAATQILGSVRGVSCR